MNVIDRFRAAGAAFRGKSAKQDATLETLLETLGVNTRDPALAEATYYACIKVLSEGVAKLPIRVQQYTPQGGVRIAREHPLYRVLHDCPNPYMTASVFWGLAEQMRDDRGNAYAYIDYDKATGRYKLWPMDPATVRVVYDNARLLKDQPALYYQYSTPEGPKILNSEEVLHFKSFQTKDGLVGISVKEQLASTIQGGAKAQKMLNRMTDSGMTAKAVLQYTGSLNDDSVKKLKEQVEAYMKGDINEKDSKNVVPIPVGFTLTPLNLKLADSQFLELRQFNALQIASAFGVKPYQVGDYTKSSYASAEAQQLSFLVDTLLYIVKHYEEEIEAKLLTDKEVADGYHVKFDTSVLLRTEFKTLIETLAQAVQSFLMTPNEARTKLDLPAVEGGDKLLGNGAAIPVELAGSQYNKQAQQAKSEESATPDPDKQREEDKAWLKEIITETLRELTPPAA
jgi:HK97 family phage portal protein